MATKRLSTRLDDIKDHLIVQDALAELHRSGEVPTPHDEVEWDSLGR